MYLFGTLYIVNSRLLFPPKEITSSVSERPINAEIALEDFLVVGPAVSCHVDQCGPLWTTVAVCTIIPVYCIPVWTSVAVMEGGTREKWVLLPGYTRKNCTL